MAARREFANGMAHVVDQKERSVRTGRDPVRPDEQAFAPSAHIRAVCLEHKNGDLSPSEHMDQILIVHGYADRFDQPGFSRHVRPVGDGFKGQRAGSDSHVCCVLPACSIFSRGED